MAQAEMLLTLNICAEKAVVKEQSVPQQHSVPAQIWETWPGYPKPSDKSNAGRQHQSQSVLEISSA